MNGDDLPPDTDDTPEIVIQMGDEISDRLEEFRANLTKGLSKIVRQVFFYWLAFELISKYDLVGKLFRSF